MYVLDNLFLNHVGLPHVLVLAVHLVKIFCWMGKGDHSSCEDAAQQVLMYVCLSVCLSELKFYL